MGWVKIPQLKIIIQTNRNIKIELCGYWVLLHKYKGGWEYERERERERERDDRIWYFNVSTCETEVI
jgi:hypothetical protein